MQILQVLEQPGINDRILAIAKQQAMEHFIEMGIIEKGEALRPDLEPFLEERISLFMGFNYFDLVRKLFPRLPDFTDFEKNLLRDLKDLTSEWKEKHQGETFLTDNLIQIPEGFTPEIEQNCLELVEA